MNTIREDTLIRQQKAALRRVRSFNKELEAFAPWIEKGWFDTERLDACRQALLAGGKPYDVLIDALCEDGVCHLRGARLAYLSRETLGLMLREIFLNGSYRFSCAADAPVILDCGANIGVAVCWYKLRWPKARVIAFEPWPKAYAVLQRNIELNGWQDVTVFPYALAGTQGEAAFHIPTGNDLAGTLTDRVFDRGPVETEETTVERRTLGQFLPAHVDFMKMDIEGTEAAVLREIAPRLADIDRIFCEYHYSAALPDNSLAAIASLLEGAGFVYTVGISEAFLGRRLSPFAGLGTRISLEIHAAQPAVCGTAAAAADGAERSAEQEEDNA